MKPYLLEVNTNPAMFTDTTVQKQLLPGLARNTLDIVLALFEGHSVSSILDKAANFGYEPIYCP